MIGGSIGRWVRRLTGKNTDNVGSGPHAPTPTGSLPDWAALIETDPEGWNSALSKSSSGPRVLIPTSIGGFAAATILESLLGVALTLRGARVAFLLCDAFLPACLHLTWAKLKNPKAVRDYALDDVICRGCVQRGHAVFDGTGLPVFQYSDFVGDEAQKSLRRLADGTPLGDIPGFRRNGIDIGGHAVAGALRFLARGVLPEGEEGEWALRRYFEAALLTEHAISGVFDAFPADSAVFHHGIYVPSGVIGEISRRRNVHVANWQVGYRKKTFIFSHHQTYHYTLISEPADEWQNLAWSEQLERETMAYLKSRWHGTEDWIWFHSEPQHDFDVVRKDLGLDATRPIVTLLTNVFWDAQLHYPGNAFENMWDWLRRSIDYFRTRPDLQAVIRIHPAEVTGAIPSRQPLTEEISSAFPRLPDNVTVVPPDSNASTYALCENSNAAIIYGTKTGVELAAMGIPVIVAGEAWIRGKGLTHDADSPEGYFEILDRLPFAGRLDAETVERAKKYAFHFFFRRFVPVRCIEPALGGDVPYTVKIDTLEELRPGRDPGLDTLCDGILEGRAFVYPAERLL